MAAEQSHLAEQGLRNETVDTLAVMAVHWTYQSEPPIDVSGFVSNVTGIAREDVDTRVDQISAGEDSDLLRHDEVTGRLLVNYENVEAKKAAHNFMGWEIVVGNKEVSVRGLEQLLKAFQAKQRAMNAEVEAQKEFGKGISFNPQAPVRRRGHLERLAERQGREPGEPVTVPGVSLVVDGSRFRSRQQ